MSDDFGRGPRPDFPPLDVRTPSERWFESGRERVARLNALVESQRFDIVAVAWLGFVLTITGAQIYRALRLSEVGGFVVEDEWWTKLELLTQSGGTILTFGCMIGIALAVLQQGRVARFALWLATIGGIWATVVGCIGIAVAFHDPGVSDSDGISGFAVKFESKAVQGMLFLGFAGLGLVLTMIAWRLVLTHGRGAGGPQPPADDGPDVVELS